MIFDVMERSDLLPIVIREGNPWGLKIISGVIPDSVNGMFSIGHFWLQGKGKRNRKLEEPIRVGLRSKQTAKRAGKYVTMQAMIG